MINLKLFPIVSITTLACTNLFAQHSAETIALAQTIPIADVHMHTYSRGGPSSAAFLEQMDKNNVKWGGAVGDYRADVADKLKDRYIPAIGQMEFMEVFFSRGASALTDEENWTFKRLYKNAEEQFANGTIKGFGELHTDNHSSGPLNIRRSIRTDNPAVRKMYSIADKYNGFVQIHSQQDENFTTDILKLAADFPNTITVLSHCLPVSQPRDLANLFSQRKNIVCEMSATGSAHNKILGINRPARAFDDNGLRPAWKKLIETYPDQIMIGTDACCGWFNSYSDMVKELRINLLPYLSPDLMEKVAYKNAVRIFNLKE
jgi:Tat protein secretion system quality control protein TatD with DNase activity